jgi:hypothetical protein
MIEIESLMANPQYTVLLSYFNSSSGVLPIINKLPYNIQEKWSSEFQFAFVSDFTSIFLAMTGF